MAEAVKVKNGEEREQAGTSLTVPQPVRRLGEYPARFRQFLHEVRAEMSRVTWPTMKDVQSTTGVVIVTVFFFGAFLYLMDRMANEMVQRIFDFFNL